MVKLTKPIIRIHDIASDEIIDREMNDAEFAQAQLDDQNAALLEAEAEAKAAQRQVILDKLGLTADEAQLLLG